MPNSELIWLFPGLLIINGALLMKLVKAGMGEILFPYASSHVKQSYHQTMNAKMCNEVRDVLTKVRFTFNHHIEESKHTLHLTFGELSPLNY